MTTQNPWRNSWRTPPFSRDLRRATTCHNISIIGNPIARSLSEKTWIALTSYAPHTSREQHYLNYILVGYVVSEDVWAPREPRSKHERPRRAERTACQIPTSCHVKIWFSSAKKKRATHSMLLVSYIVFHAADSEAPETTKRNGSVGGPRRKDRVSLACGDLNTLPRLLFRNSENA